MDELKLKSGMLAYVDSLHSGLIPCKVLSIYRDEEHAYPIVKVRITKDIGMYQTYKRGEVLSFTPYIVVPRKAVYRPRSACGHQRIRPYKVVLDK